jgi:hypothetical protein
LARRGVLSSQRSIVTIPKLGTPEEMQAQAIQQLRERVRYQKDLMAATQHSHEEEVAEMFRWIRITFMVGLPICVASALYSTFFDEHPHRVEETPEYMHVRSKEFPWQCGDCDFFDRKCWKECKAAQK